MGECIEYCGHIKKETTICKIKVKFIYRFATDDV